VILTSSSSSKHNILKQLANIKAYASLLDMVIVHEQQNHLKDFMEGKTSIVSILPEEKHE
jgi:hypothetical protein